MAVIKNKNKSAVKSKRIAYNGSVYISFDYENEHIDIDKMNIAYLYIDSSYEANVLPIMYLGLLVNDELYNKINKYKSTGQFTLSVKKFILNSKTTVEKVILEDTFSYIPSTSNVNPLQELTEASPNKGKDKYRQILIGLISKTMMNTMRKSFNGVYSKVNESTLVSLALEGTNPLIERLTTNKNYTSLIVPPMSTRYQFLKFIFEKDPFYTTDFILFMDFTRTYLLSKNGKEVKADDGKPNSVIIQISEVTSREGYEEGMSVADDHYSIDINPMDFRVVNNETSDKIVDNITVIDDHNNITNLDVDYPDETKGLNSKKVFVRNNNPSILKNELELGQVRVQVVKSYIDGSIFTPNKTYNLICNKGNEKYNGDYMLENKQEIFKPEVNDFQMSVVLTLRKIGKLNQATQTKNGSEKYTKTVNKAVTSTGKRSTTAALRSQANVRKAN